MGQIDVSDLLLDPDFVDNVTITRRAASVNSYGENVIVPTPIQTVGCVQPASGKTLQRLPEALRVTNVYSFWIQAGIVTDGSGQYPDIITFQGVDYQVQTVFDWSNWGSGWSEGTCVRGAPSL